LIARRQKEFRRRSASLFQAPLIRGQSICPGLCQQGRGILVGGAAYGSRLLLGALQPGARFFFRAKDAFYDLLHDASTSQFKPGSLPALMVFERPWSVLV
jgi:hypothetical protein